MGQIVTEIDVKVGATNIDFLAGPNYASPFVLHSILYRREKTEAIDIVIEAVMGGRVFLIDRIQSSGDQFYVFPNQRVPHTIALPNGCKIRFSTDHVSAGDEDHGVAIQWADFT